MKLRLLPIASDINNLITPYSPFHVEKVEVGWPAPLQIDAPSHFLYSSRANLAEVSRRGRLPHLFGRGR